MRSSKWTMDDLKKLPVRMVKDYTHQPNNRNIVIQDNQALLKNVKKPNRHIEDDLQENCLNTFRLLYPKLRFRLFSIPNDGIRTAHECAKQLRKGLLPGAMDLILAKPAGKYSGMFIELKTHTGRLSDTQILFIKNMQDDYYCCVCRSVEQFLKEVKDYLENT